jgi:hypothetical protein
MEYFAGSFITFIFIFLFGYYKSKKTFVPKKKTIYTQSEILNTIRTYAEYKPEIIKFNKVKRSQSEIHNDRINIKVLIMDDTAYWIKDNVFYMANLMNNGVVDKETTRIVDTMSMSSVELDKMLFIMDKLREGLENDSGGTRY